MSDDRECTCGNRCEFGCGCRYNPPKPTGPANMLEWLAQRVSGLHVEAVAWLPYVDHEGKTVHAVSVDGSGARRWHVSQALLGELEKASVLK